MRSGKVSKRSKRAAKEEAATPAADAVDERFSRVFSDDDDDDDGARDAAADDAASSSGDDVQDIADVQERISGGGGGDSSSSGGALHTDGERRHKRGIVYLSSIPPFMRPQKLRHLMEQHAEVVRVYCMPEDAKARAQRLRRGGNRKEKYTEGWVEFARRKDARRIAAELNGTQVGGHRRSFHFSDIWNTKYIRGLTWDDLVAELTYQKVMREQQLRAEMAQSRRDNEVYAKQVQRAKMQAKIAERKAKGGKGGAGGDGGKGDTQSTQAAAEHGREWEFAQRRVVSGPEDTEAEAQQRELKKIARLLVAPSGSKAKRSHRSATE